LAKEQALANLRIRAALDKKDVREDLATVIRFEKGQWTLFGITKKGQRCASA
jgi:hypothetical protein